MREFFASHRNLSSQIDFYGEGMLCLLKAWVLGITIAAPVGPIGMLCINKTLERGLIGACLVGLGASLADAVYGSITAFGLNTISKFLLENIKIIRIVGGIILLFLAYKELRSTSSSQKLQIEADSYFKWIGIVFLLTLSNPMNILKFIGIFSGFTDVVATNLSDSLSIILGIFLGSMTWWMFLGTLITFLQKKISDKWIAKIKYIASAVLALFGVSIIYLAIF